MLSLADGATALNMAKSLTFTHSTRAEFLARGEPLPVAARRPPELCVNDLLLRRLSDGHGRVAPSVRAHKRKHAAELAQLAQQYIDLIKPQWPEDARVGTFVEMVEQTLCGSKRTRPYSLDKLVATLHRQRKKPDGFERLCARYA